MHESRDKTEFKRQRSSSAGYTGKFGDPSPSEIGLDRFGPSSSTIGATADASPETHLRRVMKGLPQEQVLVRGQLQRVVRVGGLRTPPPRGGGVRSLQRHAVHRTRGLPCDVRTHPEQRGGRGRVAAPELPARLAVGETVSLLALSLHPD